MLLVIIPAYKPDDTLIKLIGDLEPYDLEKIVVDDGSGEEHEHIFNAVEDRCIVLRHEENRGKGAAIKTALGYIKDKTDGAELLCLTPRQDSEPFLRSWWSGSCPLRAKDMNMR